MERIEIRTASVEDAEELLRIYEYYVLHTAITFEYDVPTKEEFAIRIRDTLKRYPYLVAVLGKQIVGYAYAGAFVGRAAYDWSAELTVYVDHNMRKRGIGKKLYEVLEEVLRKMGILNLYVCIGYPEKEDEYLTKNSAQFHEHLGFVTVGEFHKCGYKFNRWYNMIWMEKMNGIHGTKQKGICYFSDIS